MKLARELARSTPQIHDPHPWARAHERQEIEERAASLSFEAFVLRRVPGALGVRHASSMAERERPAPPVARMLAMLALHPPEG
jgi:hypothetical protein